jgi:predicted DNA-binding protein YlxM (UPF0122 family)
MFSLLSFSLFSTGCGRSGGSGLLKGLGIVSLVALTVSTGGAANLAFAANVRGAATQAKINPKDVVIRVYDIKDTANHLFELAVEDKTNANGELVCNIENKIEAGKEYIFVAYHKVKKQAFMRAGMAITTDADTAVAISPKSEIQVRMYEEWKKDPKLVTEAEKSFNNFTKNNEAATITTTELDLVVDKYVENVAKWVKDEVAAIEEVDVSELADKVGKEDLTASEGDDINWESGKTINNLPTELKNIKWIDMTKDTAIRGHFEMVYKYNNDFDDVTPPYSYEEKRWLKFIGIKPSVTFDSNHDMVSSYYFDDSVLEDYIDKAELTTQAVEKIINTTASTVNITQELIKAIDALVVSEKLDDPLMANYMGSYTYENGLIVYSEFPEEDEESWNDYMLVKFGKLGEDIYCFMIAGSKDQRTEHLLKDETRWFVDENEDVAYDIFKLVPER